MLPAILCIIGAALGGVVTYYVMQRKLRASKRERGSLERDLARAVARTTFLERQKKTRDECIEELENQRDDYAAIASSHEVTLPELRRTPHTATHLWKERRFTHHPAANLKDLRKDLEKLGDQQVIMTLQLEYLGGWKEIVAGEYGAAQTDATEPLRAKRKLIFEGPAMRVFGQVEAFFRDDDHRFVVLRDGEKHWADGDSPMTWIIGLDLIEGGEVIVPDVHRVEVLRVQKEIEERVVERPVVKTLPHGVAESLCNHTEEEIVRLIDAVLEIRGDQTSVARELDADEVTRRRLAARLSAASKEPPER